MTLRDLGKVCPEKVQVTVLGYYSNGEYYSFYTAIYPDESVRIEDLEKDNSYLLDLSIHRSSVGIGGNSIWVDVIEIVGEKQPVEP